MGFLVVAVFAVLGFAALWRFGALSRSGLELTGAALLIGVAGYAWQGSPLQPGSTVASPESTPLPPELAEESLRKVMSSKFGAEGQWLKQADSLIQYNRTQAAVSLLRGGVARSPKNPDLWVGLGNALVVHGGGQMNPAAQFAFERAASLSPTHPGPPFFLGLALMQSGKNEEAGQVWRGLLSRAPKEAPWKADLEARLAAIGQSQGTPLPPSLPGKPPTAQP